MLLQRYIPSIDISNFALELLHKYHWYLVGYRYNRIHTYIQTIGISSNYFCCNDWDISLKSILIIKLYIAVTEPVKPRYDTYYDKRCHYNRAIDIPTIYF